MYLVCFLKHCALFKYFQSSWFVVYIAQAPAHIFEINNGGNITPKIAIGINATIHFTFLVGKNIFAGEKRGGIIKVLGDYGEAIKCESKNRNDIFSYVEYN